MSRPSDRRSHDGTWGANGEYFWGAISDGADSPPPRVTLLAPNEALRDFHGIPGSNSKYVFRAINTKDNEYEVESKFVPCYCESGRRGGACPHSHITDDWDVRRVNEKVGIRKRKTRAMKKAKRDHDDSSSEANDGDY